MSESIRWRPGDRVRVRLPDRDLRSKPMQWFTGTVRKVVDGGVFVDLDVTVNGLRDCYATHSELESAGTDGAQ